MIVGNGLIARTFLNSDFNWDDCIIFASGVSNSRESDAAAYQRELDLIDLHIATKKHFVYFSTVSIFDGELADTPYVIHKKKIEKYLLTNFEKVLVIRLPIVVGSQNNDSQLLGYIKRTIEAGEELRIFANAARYFIDVDHLPAVIRCCIQHLEVNKLRNYTINVGLPQKVNLTDIAQIVKQELGYTKIAEVSKGNSYEVDFSEFHQIAENCCPKVLEISAKKLIRNKILTFRDL
ncbi:MAG: hypothetical protein RLZZ337_69 [Bacteroidota bacterium]|jgi:nucleoside-diphosphate-sugar epimerase